MSKLDDTLETLSGWGGYNIEAKRIATKKAKQAIQQLIGEEVAKARTTLLQDLNDCGEIHHSVYDYRIEELEQNK